MGTPQFSVPTLLKLVNSNYTPKLVITKPDRPAGRNLKINFSPVKEVALKYNLPLYQPNNINDNTSYEFIKQYEPDLIITVAFGEFLKKKIRLLPTYFAINLHPSLLPLHRGADPVRDTLLSGDTVCGVTFFKLISSMDSGPIIHQKKYNVPHETNFSHLENFLSEQGAEEICTIIDMIHKTPHFDFIEQKHEDATYTSKLKKNENLADFRDNFDIFNRKLKAYNDEPGFFCYFRGKRLKLYKAELYSKNYNSKVGEIKEIVHSKGFIVSLSDCDLLITEVQFEGKKRMKASDFQNGSRMMIGERLESGI